MKNRFMVIHVRELLKYGILTIAILAMVGFSVQYTNDVIETSSTSKRLLPIYSVETAEKKVALTFDCAWRSG